MDCGNDGRISLNSCQSNPNIRIEKVREGGGGSGGGNPNRYRLSLNIQNTWWVPRDDIKWIECKDLCDICETLPGISDTGENIKFWCMTITVHVILQIVMMLISVKKK